MHEDEDTLEQKATTLLQGKVVRSVYQSRPEELVIQFEDETRLFVDISGSQLELSVT